MVHRCHSWRTSDHGHTFLNNWVSKTSWVFAGRKNFNILPLRCRIMKCDVTWLKNEVPDSLQIFVIYYDPLSSIWDFSNSKILNVLKRSVGFYIGAFLPYFLENRIDEMIPVTVSVVLLGLCLIPFPMVKKSIWKQYFIRYIFNRKFLLIYRNYGLSQFLVLFQASAQDI